MDIQTLFGLDGKVALVTGGATGIGRMAAEALMRAGATVLIASRKGDACEAVAKELNALGASGKVIGFAGDVGTEEGVDALVKAVNEHTDTLDILMNNAGITWGAPMGDFPFKAWSKVMNVNVAGLFDLTQKLLPMLRASGTVDDPARVVNVGIGHGRAGDGRWRLQLFRVQGRRDPPEQDPRQGTRRGCDHGERAGAGAVRVAHDRLCDP